MRNEEQLCDFCMSPDVVIVYPTPAIQVGPGLDLDPDWYACAVCRQLVDTRRMRELIQHVVGAVTARYEESVKNGNDTGWVLPPVHKIEINLALQYSVLFSYLDRRARIAGASLN